MQVVRPQAISDLVRAAEEFRIAPGPEQAMPSPQDCQRCGFMSSQAVCKACLLLEGLNKGMPSLGVGKQRAGKQKKDAAVQLVANAGSTTHGSDHDAASAVSQIAHGVLHTHPSARTFEHGRTSGC